MAHLPSLTSEEISRYRSKVGVRGDNECWPWLAGRHERGYGIFTARRKDYKATHVALTLDNRPRPPAPNDCALHSCHAPECCNPAHLRWGSTKDNSDDMLAAGRWQPHIGTKNGRAVLTEENVREIMSAQGSSATVAARYGVSSKQVRSIRRGEAWAHITGAAV